MLLGWTNVSSLSDLISIQIPHFEHQLGVLSGSLAVPAVRWCLSPCREGLTNAAASSDRAAGEILPPSKPQSSLAAHPTTDQVRASHDIQEGTPDVREQSAEAAQEPGDVSAEAAPASPEQRRADASPVILCACMPLLLCLQIAKSTISERKAKILHRACRKPSHKNYCLIPLFVCGSQHLRIKHSCLCRNKIES